MIQQDGATVNVNFATDFFTAYSNIERYESYRHVDNGTLFIQTVCDIWEQYCSLSPRMLENPFPAILRTRGGGDSCSLYNTGGNGNYFKMRCISYVAQGLMIFGSK